MPPSTRPADPSPDPLASALALRDLADPGEGEHAVHLVAARLEAALSTAMTVPVRREPGSRVVPVADNYDRLRYRPDDVTRDRRYTRYVGDGLMLRSHMSALMPALHDDVARHGPDDVLLSCPGICYRRDVIDRHHVGEPHQHDLWRVRRVAPRLGEADLDRMIRTVVGAVLPGARLRTPPAVHPYTTHGREIYVDVGHGEVEIGECGLTHPEILAGAGLPPGASGLAMGLGLDRLAMLVKRVPDIRLLRSTDPRVAVQMADLSPYRPVSTMPPARRDLSVAVPADLDADLLGDRVREALGPDASSLEEVATLSRTPYESVPEAARQRMGMRPGQDNVLVRLVIRDLDRTLTSDEANALRDRMYAALHEGEVGEWAVPRR